MIQNNAGKINASREDITHTKPEDSRNGNRFKTLLVKI